MLASLDLNNCPFFLESDDFHLNPQGQETTDSKIDILTMKVKIFHTLNE